MKILLFNAKRKKCMSYSPHLGLAMLAGVLREAKHQVLIVDYQYQHTGATPDSFIKKFNPDVVGVSLYTATMKEADRIISIVDKYKIPIMVGGPHAALYYDELFKDDRIKYTVRGEAENVIISCVEKISLDPKRQIIAGDPPDPNSLPLADFTSFSAYKDIAVYPLISSRGCPYDCSFCAVHLISTKRWRPREPEDCIEELLKAKQNLPNLDSVVLYDDNPMVSKDHIKTLLKLYIEKKVNLSLNVINTRADSLDEEIIILLKKAGCTAVAIAVEHGDPQIFSQIGKGEQLKEIERAAKLIKKYNLYLSFCFIIGLKDDSFEKTMQSIKFAKKNKPDHIYWNMITPFKGTKLYQWYIDKGISFSVINRSSWADGGFSCDEPCVETAEFSKYDRKKAYYTAILETVDTRLKLRHIFQLIPYIKKYKLYSSFFRWVPSRIIKNITFFLKAPGYAFTILKNNGPKTLTRKIIRYLRN